MLDIEKNPIIAAVHGMEEFALALQSGVDVIFVLNTNIFSVAEYVERGHAAGKHIFFHADMTEGIAKDSCGVEFLAKSGADGIVSTRANMLRFAKEQGLRTVQRFFIIDAQSVKTTVDSAKSVSPDYIEIMPGLLPKVIKRLKGSLTTPIITGGLIETKAEVVEALSAGATAISTSNSTLWDS